MKNQELHSVLQLILVKYTRSKDLEKLLIVFVMPNGKRDPKLQTLFHN